MITVAAKEQGLDWLRAVDGSGANSGTEFIDDHFIPTGDWRTLKVEGSDTACRYGRKPGKCVVILRTKETAADVKRKRPGAIIVPGLGGALGDLSSTKVRNARDPAVVERFCGPAVAKAWAHARRRRPPLAATARARARYRARVSSPSLWTIYTQKRRGFKA